MDAKQFGQILRNLRNAKGMTLVELGKETGFSDGYLSMIENGHKGIPQPKTLKKIASSLEADYDLLMHKAGYISKEIYDKQMELKKEIKLRKSIIGDIEQDLNTMHERADLLRHEYHSLESSLTGSPYDEDKTDLLKRIKNSLEHTLSRYSGALTVAKRAEEDIEDLEIELNKINKLIEKRDQATVQEEEKINKEILSDVKRIISKNKEVRPFYKLTQEQINNLDKGALDIEKILSEDSQLNYKGKLLTSKEKKKIMALIEITLN